MLMDNGENPIDLEGNCLSVLWFTVSENVKEESLSRILETCQNARIEGLSLFSTEFCISVNIQTTLWRNVYWTVYVQPYQAKVLQL